MPKTVLSNNEVVKSLGLPDDILERIATAEGDTYEAVSNQFLSALVNKIVYQKVHRMRFTNPFKNFESYPVKFGDTVENLWIELPEGYTYDKDATDPFAIKIQSAKSLYASLNYEMQYQITIYRKLLKRAVLNEYGLMDVIDYMVSSVGTKKDIDEYQATVYMLNNEDIFADGFEELEVPAAATALERYKAITQKIVDVATDFALPCKDNNALKVMNVTSKEDVVLIIKQEILNHINLDYLAGVFNLDKVHLVEHIIPVRSFQVVKPGATGVDASVVGEDLDFMLLDANGFDIHDALQDSGSIYNPKGKYTNQFTDSWKIIAYKYFFNARAFKVTTGE